MLATAKGMIATIKNAVAAISKIVLWPLTMLAKSVTKANRHMIRWAFRHDSRAAYLLAIFWAPALIVAGVIWLAVAMPPKPATLLVFGISIFVPNKALGVALVVAQQLAGSVKALPSGREPS